MKQVCVGSLNRRIEIAKQGINTGAVVTTEASIVLWASIKTRTGVKELTDSFGNTTLETHTTHDFTIRYSPDYLPFLDIGNIIKYNDKIYTIRGYQNIDERNRFILIRTAERGDDAFDANLRR